MILAAALRKSMNKNSKHRHSSGKKRTERKKSRMIKLSLFFFIYLTIMNLFSISTAVVLHEFGHFIVGSAYECSGRIIIFEFGGEGPYTELLCPSGTPENAVSLGGLLLIIPFGLVFLIFRDHPMKNFSLVIIGLAITLSGLDFVVAYGSPMLFYISILVGFAMVVAGEHALVEDYMNQIEHRHHFIF